MNPPTRVERAWQIYLAVVQGIYADPTVQSTPDFTALAKAAHTAERAFMEEAGK
jgi:hypothetical protein